MFDLKVLRAAGAMIARQAREKVAADPHAANDIIDMYPLLKKWTPGTGEKPAAYTKREVCVHENMPWLCTAGHVHHGEPGWEPGGNSALWALCHGRDAAHALPFVEEGHNPYMTGHWCTENGKAYQCIADNTVWPPSMLPENWEAEI